MLGLKTLVNIIIKKYSDDVLNSIESKLYDCFYEEFFENDKVEKKLENDKIIFDFLYSANKEQGNNDEDLDIFNGLLHYRGKTVSLEEFCFYCGYDGSNCEIRKKVLEKINGCFAEARVGEVDLDSFSGRNFQDIELNSDKIDNPMLFITSLCPEPIKEIKIDNSDVNIISISDLHLGEGCIDENGNIDKDKFNEYLDSYVVFINKLISDMKKRNIKIDGVVYVGDIFDAYASKANLTSHSEEFRDEFIKLIEEYNNSHDSNLNIKLNDNGFICFLAGNHDMTLGKERFIKVISELGEDAIYLGNGAARIKINDQYVTFSHPNAYDWGVPGFSLFSYEIRNSLASRIFCFDEYFQICKMYFDNYTCSDKNSRPLEDFLLDVNEGIKKNNFELYKFYEPFITDGIKNRAYFSQFITLDVENETLKMTARKPTIMGYKKYIEKNSNIESLLEDKNPIFTTYENRPVLNTVGHFHEKPKNSSIKVGSIDYKLPIYALERSSSLKNNQYLYNFSLYTLKVEGGEVKNILIKPYSYSLLRKSIDGQVVYSGGLSEYMNSVSYSKK